MPAEARDLKTDVVPKATLDNLKGEFELQKVQEQIVGLSNLINATNERISDIQWLTAFVGAVFAVLLSVLIVFFSLRTEKAAVSAVLKDLEVETKASIDAIRESALKAAEEANAIIDSTREKSTELEGMINSAKSSFDFEISRRLSIVKDGGITRNERETYISKDDVELARDRVVKLWSAGNGSLATREIQEKIRKRAALDEKSLDEIIPLIFTGISQSSEKKDFDQSIILYQEVIDNFSLREERSISDIVEVALNGKANSFRRLEKYEEAIKTYHNLITRLENRQGIEASEKMIGALLSLSMMYYKTENLIDRKFTLDRAIKISENPEFEFNNIETKRDISSVLLVSALNHSRLGEFDLEIEKYEKLVSRMEDESDLNIERDVASAMRFWWLQEVKGNAVEAERIFNKLKSRFGNHIDADIKKVVTDTIRQRGK